MEVRDVETEDFPGSPHMPVGGLSCWQVLGVSPEMARRFWLDGFNAAQNRLRQKTIALRPNSGQ